MKKQARLILSLGSNTDSDRNIQEGKVALEKLFGDVTFSDTVETKAVGMDAPSFLNCLASTYTKHGYTQLHRALKQIERKMGSLKFDRSRGIVRLDLDILMLGDVRYHPEDWDRDYVKRLISQLG